LPEGLVETAANGLLSCELLSTMCEDLGVRLLKPIPSAKKRFILTQGRPRRWPLGVGDSLLFGWRLLQLLLFKRKSLSPQKLESVAHYVRRVFSVPVLDRLVAPALQGIYAGEAEKLSARLLLGRFFGNPVETSMRLVPLDRQRKGGTVSPLGGMGELVHALRRWLSDQDVKFNYNYEVDIDEGLWVVCTSVRQASVLLNERAPELANSLAAIPMLPLISVTVFFKSGDKELEGFGCLFPRSEGLRALGVVFNSSVFEGRSQHRSETWIFGGAIDLGVMDWTDEGTIGTLLEDRRKAFGLEARPVEYKITRWPKALPHFTTELERTLEELELPKGIWLHGNYLGSIGLSQILERSFQMAETLCDDCCL
ncbi:MAG: hypothetical protein KDD22_00710, partial [Bdellovibrionales bacterium]|nr:hypothetical protein [Bdellovibrionales bacterium]